MSAFGDRIKNDVERVIVFVGEGFKIYATKKAGELRHPGEIGAQTFLYEAMVLIRAGARTAISALLNPWNFITKPDPLKSWRRDVIAFAVKYNFDPLVVAKLGG